MASHTVMEPERTGEIEPLGQARILIVGRSALDAPQVAERLLRSAIAECRVEAIGGLAEAITRLDDQPAELVLLGTLPPPVAPVAALNQLRSAAPEALLLPMDRTVDAADSPAGWLGRALRHLARERTRAIARRAAASGPDTSKSIDTVSDAVLMTDRAGHVTASNARAPALTGWPATEAEGEPLSRVLTLRHALTHEPVASPVAIAMARDQIVGLSAANVLQRRDGATIPIHYGAAPIHDTDGRVTGAVVVLRRLPNEWTPTDIPKAPIKAGMGRDGSDDEASSGLRESTDSPSGPVANARATDQLIAGTAVTPREDGGPMLEYQPECAPDEARVLGLRATPVARSVGDQSLTGAARKPANQGSSSRYRVLCRACRQIGAWRRAGLWVPQVSLDADAAGMEQNGFASRVTELLRRTGVAPSQLELTFRQKTLEAGGEAIQRTLATLRELGVGLALTDCGTGHASLKQLRHLPIDTLRLAPGVLRDIATNERSRRVATGMMGLAKRLNYRLVVQGVDTERQLAFAREHGCDAVRGHRVGRPLDVYDAGLLVAMSDTMGSHASA